MAAKQCDQTLASVAKCQPHDRLKLVNQKKRRKKREEKKPKEEALLGLMMMLSAVASMGKGQVRAGEGQPGHTEYGIRNTENGIRFRDWAETMADRADNA